MATLDPIQLNIDGVRQLVGSQMNKIQSSATNEIEGIEGEYEDEFTLKMTDEELLQLKNDWETNYMGYEARIAKRQEANKIYYLGRQNQGTSVVSESPIAGNILFEAEETFLPQALSKNPDPVVYSDNTKEGSDLSDIVKTMLQYHADVLALRPKLRQATRGWSLDYLGCIKHGWDNDIQDIKSDVVDVKKLIFDPDSKIDAYGDSDSYYIGERKTCTASRLSELFPKHETYITLIVDGKMGTKVNYTEWWTDEYCFYTFKDKVLDKNKNPHFNYDKLEPQTDIDGVETEQEVKGTNHFAKPKKPYTFLSVFSLGDQPHDNTGLIEQNIPNQNLVSRRTMQIDANLSRANNSIALSGQNFNEQTGKQAGIAMEKGHPVLVPAGGKISDSIVRFDAPAYPASAFQGLEIAKTDLRSIFGTEGISSQQPTEDTTARGMILNQQFDNTRIGGGIGDSLEQMADNIFNWWVQMYYVYYDEPHFAAVMGQMKAVEYVTLSSQDLDRQLIVSVAPDSMKPHDEITEMNQAMQLWEAQALDPKTLLTMLNVPDPQDTAESTVLWLIDKNAYLQLNFPELATQLQQMQQQNQQQQIAQQGAQGAQPGGQPSPIQLQQPGSTSAPPASGSLGQVPIKSNASPK